MSERKASVNDCKQAIIQRIDIRSYYLKYIPSTLKHPSDLREETGDGWSNRVLCPLHNDQNTPAFFVNLSNGSFRCQTCGKGGSLFDFWLMIHGFAKEDKRKFADALVGLATEAGLDIKQWQRDFEKGKVSSGNYNTLPAGATQKTSSQPDPNLPKMSKADANDKSKQPIAKEKIEELQRNLNTLHYAYLVKRGLTKKTIEEAKIGFDLDAVGRHRDTNEWIKGRYALPVFDRKGECRNFRLYSPLVAPDYKMINYKINKGQPNEESYGKPVRLYGLHKLVSKQYANVVICEGEWDCLLLNQQFEQGGYTSWVAVTGTHGANTFEPDWVDHFKGMNVYLCYDCDQPGKLAATDHANKFFLPCLPQFASVHLVDLPLDGSKEMKDISDLFLKAERSIDEFVKICTDTPEIIAGGMSFDEATQEAEYIPDFIIALKDRRYIDKRIQVPITISGQSSRVYHAIRSYAVVRCPLMKKGEDAACCSELNTERTIPYGHPLFIEACMEKERNILTSIARMTCQKEERCSVSPISKVIMEEYFANQVIQRWKSEEDNEGQLRNAQELVTTSVYILQPEANIAIEPQNYLATGYIRTHPKTSIATFFIESMTPMEEDWKKFTLESTDGVGSNLEVLKKFKEEFKDVGEILQEITDGVTHIYKMDEILLTVLLNYLAPLWFNFNGSMQRGWINAAIIGDSGTGKSKSYQRFSDWIELGDLFSALSGTRTGLLYAIKRKNEEWHVSIGRYVQASGKIIAVDEMQKVLAEEAAKMAIAMDEGKLQVEQVASGCFKTQTRLIMLLNPKDLYGKAATVSDFTHGCDALRMCFDPMFIRRMDIAIFTTGSHSHEFYNQRVAEDVKKNMRITPRMIKTLIYWAWTRKADQIHWTEAAVDAVLKLSTALSSEYGYSDQVPLINPQDFRLKLARLSVAFAILDRNFTEDIQGIIVEAKHVEFMANFVDQVYSAPACNLKHKSKIERVKKSLDDFDKIKDAFEAAIKASRESLNEMRRSGDYLLRFLSTIHSLGKFQKRTIAEQLNVNISWVNKRIMIMQGYNLVDIAQHGGYCTTRKFNMFMMRWLQDPEIEKMFLEIQDKIGKQALEQADSLDPYERMPTSHVQHSDPYNDPFTS